MAMGRMNDDGDETSTVFSEINITPLTDIFLVLLIIFMVGASMAVESSAGSSQAGGGDSGMEIDLPQGAARDLAPTSNDVSVAILSDGRVVLAGEEVPDDSLVARLTDARSTGTSTTLIVQADEGVPHGRVVQVMERAREAGFVRLAVATRGD